MVHSLRIVHKPGPRLLHNHLISYVLLLLTAYPQNPSPFFFLHDYLKDAHWATTEFSCLLRNKISGLLRLTPDRLLNPAQLNYILRPVPMIPCGISL